MLCCAVSARIYAACINVNNFFASGLVREQKIIIEGNYTCHNMHRQLYGGLEGAQAPLLKTKFLKIFRKIVVVYRLALLILAVSANFKPQH